MIFSTVSIGKRARYSNFCRWPMCNYSFVRSNKGVSKEKGNDRGKERKKYTARAKRKRRRGWDEEKEKEEEDEWLREVTCVHVRSRYSNCMATALAQSLSPLSFLSFPLVAYLSFFPSRKFSPRKVSWYVQMRAYTWNQSRSSCQRREESAPNHSGTYARGMLPDALTFHKSQSRLTRFSFFFFVPLLFRGETRGNVSFFYPVADGQKFKLFRILQRKRTNERC